MSEGTLKERIFEFIAKEPDGVLPAAMYFQFIDEANVSAQLKIVDELIGEGRVERNFGQYKNRIHALQKAESAKS